MDMDEFIVIHGRRPKSKSEMLRAAARLWTADEKRRVKEAERIARELEAVKDELRALGVEIHDA